MKRYMLLSSFLVFGCADSSQKLLETQPLDPAEAAAAAISEYDTDNDGAISVSEAKSSALDPKAGWDADGDKKISAEEIQARLERYEKVKPGHDDDVLQRGLSRAAARWCNSHLRTGGIFRRID